MRYLHASRMLLLEEAFPDTWADVSTGSLSFCGQKKRLFVSCEANWFCRDVSYHAVAHFTKVLFSISGKTSFGWEL